MTKKVKEHTEIYRMYLDSYETDSSRSKINLLARTEDDNMCRVLRHEYMLAKKTLLVFTNLFSPQNNM